MKTIQVINLVFLVVSLILLLAIPVIGISSATANWHGMCYGFTDSQLPCSWWEFAKNEMFWNSLMFIPWLAMTLGIGLIVNIVQWVVRANGMKSL